MMTEIYAVAAVAMIIHMSTIIGISYLYVNAIARVMVWPLKPAKVMGRKTFMLLWSLASIWVGSIWLIAEPVIGFPGRNIIRLYFS
jgi:hypothetical protein